MTGWLKKATTTRQKPPKNTTARQHKNKNKTKRQHQETAGTTPLTKTQELGNKKKRSTTRQGGEMCDGEIDTKNSTGTGGNVLQQTNSQTTKNIREQQQNTTKSIGETQRQNNKNTSKHNKKR